MRFILWIALVALLVACSGGPNLDQAVPGQLEPTIRSAVAGHLGWGEKLTADQLDQVATFLATYAGADAVPPSTDPGLAVWQANDCGRCHALAAAEAADAS